MEERLKEIKNDLDANIIDLNVIKTIIIDYANSESLDWEDGLIKHYDVKISENQENVKEKEIKAFLTKLICKDEISIDPKMFLQIWTEFTVGAQKMRKDYKGNEEIVYEI